MVRSVQEDKLSRDTETRRWSPMLKQTTFSRSLKIQWGASVRLRYAQPRKLQENNYGSTKNKALRSITFSWSVITKTAVFKKHIYDRINVMYVVYDFYIPPAIRATAKACFNAISISIFSVLSRLMRVCFALRRVLIFLDPYLCCTFKV